MELIVDSVSDFATKAFAGFDHRGFSQVSKGRIRSAAAETSSQQTPK